MIVAMRSSPSEKSARQGRSDVWRLEARALLAGDITVHNERVIHGSGPNRSPGWRHAYVVAFRKAACIAEERSLGFTHSHNDETNWDVFHEHGKEA